MTTEPFGTELIERYLRTRRLRYFRGQHDGEYFFILGGDHKRLHVHLEISRDPSAAVTVRVTLPYFFAAVHRAQLTAFSRSWNQDNPAARVVVHESTDPTRVGVVAESSHPVCGGMSADDFATRVDQTIHSAIRFFGELTPAVEVPGAAAREKLVLDAG